MLQVTDAWNGRANEEEQIELHQGEGATIKRVTACSRSLMPGMVEQRKEWPGESWNQAARPGMLRGKRKEGYYSEN
jgi:hypothetical protein